MRGIYETRCTIDATEGPQSSFGQIGEASSHYRRYKLNSTTNATRFAMEVLGGYFADRRDAEEVLIVALDTKLHPLRIVRITRGTLDASLLHPREVFRPAIQLAAHAILLVHNHPSGDPTPSWQDFDATKKMEEAGKLIGIQVIDHIVVGDGEAVSILEKR